MVAAAGGGGGITAAVLQDHALAWAALSAFALWLAYSLAIAWLAGSGTRGRRNRAHLAAAAKAGPVQQARPGLGASTPGDAGGDISRKAGHSEHDYRSLV